MDKCINFLEEGKAILFPAGVLGKRKRIVFIDKKPEAINEAMSRPFNDFEKQILSVIFKNYSKKVRSSDLIKKIRKNICEHDLHIDHKISVYSCFWNNIPVKSASNITNLRVIHSVENRRKYTKNFIDEHNRWIAVKYGIEK